MRKFASYAMALVLLAVLFMTGACRKEPSGQEGALMKANVMLLYSCGYNNLSSALKEDIKDVLKSRIPYYYERGSYRFMVFSQLSKTSYDWKTSVEPTLVEYYKDIEGGVCADTLMRCPATDVATSAVVMNKVLEYVKELVPDGRYGMIFSSHSTGWLPLGWTGKANDEIEWMSVTSQSGDSLQQGASGQSGVTSQQGVSSQPQSSYAFLTAEHDTKTIGAHFVETSKVSREIEFVDFAAAIPEDMHLQYLVMDACLAGGIEIAYEIKDKVHYYVASQTEILSDGFPYDRMTYRLLFRIRPDVKGLADDFYHLYADRSSSCTISVVDCRHLEALADVCGGLFEKHRSEMDAINPSKVQLYFRYNWHWFYDLKDILAHCSLSPEEEGALDSALASAVIYKNATPRAFGLDMSRHCGLSMFLPCNGSAALKDIYRDYAWNRSSGLVK